MKDKDLADRVVALGVGKTGPEPFDNYYYHGKDAAVLAFAFVRDWRVAGALMERCWSVDIYREDDRYDVEAWTRSGPEFGRAHQYEGQDQSLPRAIIEACVKALEAR